MSLLNKSRGKVSSRQQIQIKEVRDNVLVLPGNKYRKVLETSSVNFELKSDAEQDVLIDSFQNFLNSLPCPIQILIRVREVDIDQYVEQMSQMKEHETEAIYREQISNYCTFIQKLVSGNKILTRKFYVVIPYDLSEKNNDFSLIQEHLNLHKDIVTKGLEKLGMKARTLTSLELLDLFYSFYNPEQSKTQQLKDETIQALLANIYV